MALSLALPWHDGENAIHRRLGVEGNYDNPTSSMLTPYAAYLLQRSPLLAIGTLDSEGRPWTTVWGGDPGFASSLGSSIIGLSVTVDRKHDPVVAALLTDTAGDDVSWVRGQGKMVGGLAIDLLKRQRVKLYGRLAASTINTLSAEEGEDDIGIGEMRLVVRIEQSLGNCPKYLNQKRIQEAPLTPRLVSQGALLSDEALTLLHKADLFFISSSHESFDMDTNHRGGPPGFVRVLSNEPGGAVLVYPEYSGNRLYQTLGNLQTTPLAGLVFPDFDTGSVLYVTGSTEILVGNDAAALMPRSNLAIKITLTDTRLVERGLSFRGVPFESSPYNPDVRLLVTEGNIVAKIQSRTTNAAKLIRQTRITPSISRFRFALSNAGQYKPGQWVAMDFSKELDIGYSHMRDDDPRSLNDDYVRTFTVSSAPTDAGPVSHDEFEITIRKVGAVTSFLFNQSARSSLNVPVQGFGGDFQIGSPKGEELVPFIAGGVGITPLLPQLAMLDVSKLRLFWTLRVDDVKFALDVLSTNPQLRLVTTVFFTTGKGITDDLEESLSTLDDWKVQHHMRRITSEDLLTVNAQTWYICAGGGLKKVLLQWLHGRTVIFEDFNF